MIYVIVPVYNSEKYLSRCINSILCQSFTEWLAIIVDDGSTDSSLEIAKSYEKKDSRITVFSQKNKGAGAARNFGIEKTGDNGYLVFLDSDDYLEKNYFELLNKHSEEVVYIDVNRRGDGGNVVVEKLSKYMNESKNNFLRSQMTGQILWGGVRKAVKTDLIKKNCIRFSSTKVGEEAIYSFLVCYYAESWSFITDPVYNYIVHEGSLSQSMNKDPWGEVVYELRNKLKEMDIYETYADTINAFEISAMTVSIWRMAKKFNLSEYLSEAKRRVNKAFNSIDTRFKIDKKHLSAKTKIVYLCIRLRMYLLVRIMAKIL